MILLCCIIVLHLHCTSASAITKLKPHSARTGRLLCFSHYSAAVVRHKANDGAVYAI